MKLVSNRAARQQIQQQSRTLGELGMALDSQSQAISGLADNQRVLHDGFVRFYTLGFWARLRWLVFGPTPQKAPPNEQLPQAGDHA